ncbi:hypothetical protein KO498_13475 [Lentibacter algarum]|uniref:cupin domain-containing protein n=1 Tax=Lentibacter algarum TaxID=576131 RepID=UPI001C08C693|nr:hypothetical protein [Lentibacter algarum]MBU2982822.1 hypothetical protein [Lentibacter algarum]
MLMEKRTQPGVYGYAAKDLTWRKADKKGMALASVRASREEGKYLGYLRADSMTETGIHQHLGPATSYFLEGGFADYDGYAGRGMLGVNLAGATHSAMAYVDTLMVSRLEAPVIYPSEDMAGNNSLHTGSYAGEIVNEHPEVSPDINIQVDGVRLARTEIERVSRRVLFDYIGSGENRRCAHMQLLPYSEIPEFTTHEPLDIFVVGGALCVGGEWQEAGAFFVVDPGATTSIKTEFGAMIMVWSEAPITWVNADYKDPFGF